MAEDKDLFGQPRDRRSGSEGGSSGSGKSGTPRTPKSGSSPMGRPPRYGHGSFLNKVNKSVAKAHAAKGTNRYSKSKPKTGRFNARGRGRRAYTNGIGPNKGWPRVIEVDYWATHKASFGGIVQVHLRSW